MPDQTSIDIIKAAVQKRVQYTADHAAAEQVKFDEMFKQLALNISSDALLLRGETVEYTLRLKAFDVLVQDRETRLNIHDMFERLSAAFGQLGVTVALTDENTWERGQIGFTVYIYKTS